MYGLSWFPYILLFMLIPIYSDASASVSTITHLKSSVSFSYSTTNAFLDLVRGNSPPTVGLTTYANIMTSDSRQVSFRQLQPILTSYVGYIVCLLIGLLFIILVPIVGFFFCCCRCCGRCGSRVNLMDGKNDPYKRIAYTIVVVILVTVQLVTVVLAFINHFLMHEYLVNEHPNVSLFSQLNQSAWQVERALDEMLEMARTSTASNVGNEIDNFILVVDNGLREIQRDFIRDSDAVSVTSAIEDLKQAVKRLGPSSADTLSMQAFMYSVDDLNRRLPQIRTAIVEVLDTNCPVHLHVKCTNLMRRAETDLNIRYTSSNAYQFDEFKTLQTNVQNNLQKMDSLNKFNATLYELANLVRRAIDPDLKSAISDVSSSRSTRLTLTDKFDQIVNILKSYLQQFRQQLGVLNKNQDSRSIFLRVIEFRLYYGIALLCVPVLIILLMYLGLCFGTCGHRPFEEAGVCNRGVGANLLLAGVGFIFLLSAILMLFCTALFVIGGPLQTEVCRYLTGHIPNGTRLFDEHLDQSLTYMIDQVYRQHKLALQREPTNSLSSSTVELGGFEMVRDLFKSRLTDAVLNRCENEPFVNAISGGQLALPVLRELIQDILKRLIDSFKQKFDLTEPMDNALTECKAVLNQMKFLQLVNFTEALNQLTYPLTRIDELDKFISDLRILGIPTLDEHITDLERVALRPERSRTEIHNLLQHLHKLPDQRDNVLVEIALYSARLPGIVQTTMDSSLTRLEPLFEHELQLAVIASWRNIPCQSLRKGVKQGVDTVCVSALMPLNSFWGGLGLALLLCIPLIIFAVKLAGLYRKTEEYASDYEEPDYISYHGFYMRPTSDYQVVPVKPRNQMRNRKANGSYQGVSSKKRGNPNSRYHQVSVYPYDAYE